MSAPKVLLHTDSVDLAREVLARTHPDLTPEICDDFDSLADCVARQQTEVVYTCNFLHQPYPREALMDAPSVKWISNSGSGVNHLAPWDPARVTVTNSAGVMAEAMAQYAIGMMLHFGLDVPGLMADQRARHWGSRFVAPLRGKTLAIVGLGKTGCETARLASAMEMRVLGVRARPQPTAHVDEVYAVDDLPKALAEADHILVCLPLLPTTRGLMGEAAFASVKPGAVLVDVSRSGILEPEALIAALDRGVLSGAALDVTSPEPLPQDHPLWTREDVLISPHCSGAYDGWEERSLEWFAANLHRWRRGEALRNIVDPKRGY
ncbi:D-2-hydroxyacid dehydrogenase [Rhodobacteraceae bacterium NNCM2]|nr:D-2-hydroxyacid dehydrogenase [Coraliihabitans acroporae]